jgi:hypothetical protein
VYFVTRCFDSLPTSEDIHAIQINGVDFGAVICEESRKWPANDLRAVYNGDGFAKQTISVREDGVVDLEIFQNFDYGEWRAGENRLLGFLLIEKSDILIHVEEIVVAESFDIFCGIDKVLNVTVLPGGSRENRVVNDNTVDGLVGIGIDDFLLDVFLLNGPEAEIKATGEKSASKSSYISIQVRGKSRVDDDDLDILGDYTVKTQ